VGSCRRFESSYALIFRVEQTNDLLCENLTESGQHEEEEEEEDYDDDDDDGDDDDDDEEEDKSSPSLGPFSDAIFGYPTDVYLDTQVFWHVTPYLSAEEVKRLR
jgi:ABC-type Zn2+ transport system substrate-binding protein/surface adhesin